MSAHRQRRPSTGRFIATHVYKGMSVNRALLHLQVMKHVVVRGKVLDVGGGSRQTYLSYMNIDDADCIVALDIQPRGSDDIHGSATQMPIKAESFDTVLCFNLLEHVYEHRRALREIRRVMKPGAILYGWTPFALGVHGAPNDYWRYTPEAFRNLLSETGLSSIEVEACGGVFLSAFDLVRPYVRGWILGKLIRVCGVMFALLVTHLFILIDKVGSARQNPSSCPNGVWFVARRNQRTPLV